jgi:hypothetical protein
VIAEAFAEVKRRLAAAWPNAEDRTGSSVAIASARLPAWSLEVQLDGVEPHSLRFGEAAPYVLAARYRLILSLWAEPPRGREEATMLDAGLHAAAAILGTDHDLGGLVFAVELETMDVDHDTGEARIARVDVEFALILHAPIDAVDPPPIGLV